MALYKKKNIIVDDAFQLGIDPNECEERLLDYYESNEWHFRLSR